MSTPDRLRVRTADEVELSVRLARPAGSSRATVIAMPGMFSQSTFFHGTRAHGLAHALAARGFTVLCPDPRGHGDSTPFRGQPWSFQDWARHDLPALAEQADPERPLYLIGHSAGGAAVLAAVAMGLPARGVVVAGTPYPNLRTWRRAGAAACRWLSRRRPLFPARALRVAPEDEVGSVIAEWMDWNLTGRWSEHDYLQRLSRLELPLLTVAGEGDHVWAPRASCLQLAAALPRAQKSFLICGRAVGMERDYDHIDLIASRPASRDVWPAICDWLETQTAPEQAPSG